MQNSLHPARFALVAAALTVFFLAWPGPAAALPAVYTSTSETQTLTAGITYEQQTRFTVDGWLSLHILRADLSNPNVRLDALFNSEGLGNTTSVQKMAQNAGAVAAVNGSLFWLSGGKGALIGPMVQDGRLMAAVADVNNNGKVEIATLFSTDGHSAAIDYWLFQGIRVNRTDGLGINIVNYNLPYAGTAAYSLIDGNLQSVSVGAEHYPDIVELVVADGIVQDLRFAQPAVPIPPGGFVVVTRGGEAGAILAERFPIGAAVELDARFSVDWHNVQTAVSGVETLLKDGQIPAAYSYDINGTLRRRQPRTAAGISADGFELILLAVDGRQNASIGVTQRELSSLLLELGAYQAIGFDSGGSTTFVYRKPGTENIVLGNSPSDGSQRNVPNSIGLFSAAPPGRLAQLLLNAGNGRVFAGATLSLDLKGLDENGNPLSLDGAWVEWSAAGLEGTFSGNAFYPAGEGQGSITARVGDLEVSRDIVVLSPPVQLTVSPEKMYMVSGETQTLTLSGRNQAGFSAAIRPEDVSTELGGGVGWMDGGTFVASGHGTGWIAFRWNGLTAYAAVSVKDESANIMIVEDFEEARWTFAGSAPSVNGTYLTDNITVRRADTSGRLVYIFDEGAGESVREARLQYTGGGIAVPADRERAALWVYSPVSWADGSLVLRFTDGDGARRDITLVSSVNWEGWKYFDVALNLKAPARLEQIVYVRAGSDPEAGEFYFDNLLFAKTIVQPVIPPDLTPKTPRPRDSAWTSVNDGAGETYNFALLAQPRELDRNKSAEARLLSAVQNLDQNVDGWILTGAGNHKLAAELQKPVVAPSSGCSTTDIGPNRFIRLDISKGGMRLTNPEQWYWFMRQLADFQGENLFVCLANSLSYFQDPLEAALLEKELADFAARTGKNVALVYRGTEDFGYIKDGIRYICNKGIPTGDLNAPVNYLRFTVKGGTLTYEFLPV
ncbi:MAG: phosphodiester glycosidase family protein [Gracilibacteraceae bacterium]|nr:phosphodiester glycosidase family protein [Gracilibacteraceae bacterium]